MKEMSRLSGEIFASQTLQLRLSPTEKLGLMVTLRLLGRDSMVSRAEELTTLPSQ